MRKLSSKFYLFPYLETALPYMEIHQKFKLLYLINYTTTHGVIGQTKQEAFVTEWELPYHEVLAISKCHKEITGSQLANSDADLTHREQTARSIVEYNEAVSKFINFMKEKGNPYLISANTKLHHFTSGQIVPESTALTTDKKNTKVSEEVDSSQRQRS